MEKDFIEKELLKINTPLYNFAFKLTMDKDNAQDLVQDTIIRMLTNKEKFTYNPQNIKSWAFTIMRNLFINNYRKENKVREIFENIKNTDSPIDDNDDIESNFFAKEILKHIESISKTLSIPFLMYCNGYKYEEIAKKLNLPTGTIKSQIFNFRKTFKEKYSEYKMA